MALEGELNSSMETGVVFPVRHIPRGVQVLPMEVVFTLKPQPGTPLQKKKARGCVCGNYQEKLPTDFRYTANIDVTTIRLVLAVSSQFETWGITVMDVVTAFLRAPMPVTSEENAVYVKPPALFEKFDLVKPGTYWKLVKAVYGLRVSPRLWGKSEIKDSRRYA